MSMEAFVAATRAALGLEKRHLDGSVYFAGRAEARPTLVLIHGANDQAGTWASAVPLLSEYRLIVPDLAGHGESAPHSGPIPIPVIVDQLHAIIENECRTGFSPSLSLAGNSMGGWIGMLYALDHPQKVSRLVLEDSGGMSWDLSGLPLVPQTREQARLAMRLVLGPKAPIPPDYVLDAMVRRALRTPMLRLIQSGAPQYAVDNRLGELKSPVTMIWGDSDGVLPLKYAETLQSRIVNAKLQVIEECGHIPHRQKPELFVSLLREAIDV